MTNSQAYELFKLLTSIPSAPGSKRAYAVARTLRKMQPFIDSYREEMERIDIENCLTEDKNGQKIIVKQILKKTQGNITEEVAVPSFSVEGEKKRAEARKKFLMQEAPSFEIFKTDDVGDLNEYQLIALAELGFVDERVVPNFS